MQEKGENFLSLSVPVPSMLFPSSIAAEVLRTRWEQEQVAELVLDGSGQVFAALRARGWQIPPGQQVHSFTFV